MPLPTLFEVCAPRDDVLRGNLAEADFAADLTQVLRGEAPHEYRDAALFFANTHPTRGLKTLLANVCLRLQGESGQPAAVFRLDQLRRRQDPCGPEHDRRGGSGRVSPA